MYRSEDQSVDRNRCLRKTAETISQGEGRAQPLPPQDAAVLCPQVRGPHEHLQRPDRPRGEVRGMPSTLAVLSPLPEKTGTLADGAVGWVPRYACGPGPGVPSFWLRCGRSRSCQRTGGARERVHMMPGTRLMVPSTEGARPLLETPHSLDQCVCHHTDKISDGLFCHNAWSLVVVKGHGLT